MAIFIRMRRFTALLVCVFAWQALFPWRTTCFALTEKLPATDESGPIIYDLRTKSQAQAAAQSLIEQATELRRKTGRKPIRAKLIHIRGELTENHELLLKLLEQADIELDVTIVTEAELEQLVDQTTSQLPTEAQTQQILLKFADHCDPRAVSEECSVLRRLGGALNPINIAKRLHQGISHFYKSMRETTFLEHWIIQDQQGHWHRRFVGDIDFHKAASFAMAGSVLSLSMALWWKGISPRETNWWIAQIFNMGWTYGSVMATREFSSMRMQHRVYWINGSDGDAMAKTHDEIFFLGSAFVLNWLVNAVLLWAIVGTQDVLSAALTTGTLNAALTAYCNLAVDRWQSSLALRKEKEARQGNSHTSSSTGHKFTAVVAIWGGFVFQVLRLLQLFGETAPIPTMLCAGTLCILLEPFFAEHHKSTIIEKIRHQIRTLSHPRPTVCETLIQLSAEENN